MDIMITATAGTLESSDIMITAAKALVPGIAIDLTSSVEKQFGQQIKETIIACARQLGVEDVHITVVDQGALDCVVRARTKTALYRATQRTDYTWEA